MISALYAKFHAIGQWGEKLFHKPVYYTSLSYKDVSQKWDPQVRPTLMWEEGLIHQAHWIIS